MFYPNWLAWAFLDVGWAILGDSQTTLKLFWADSRWFANHSELVLGWFSVILDNSQTTLKICLDDSWSFLVIHEPFWNFFGVILSDSQTTLKFLRGDSQWFANHSKISLGKFLAICKPLWIFWSYFHRFWVIHKLLWNCFGWFLVILGDSQTTLKFPWGNS